MTEMNMEMFEQTLERTRSSSTSFGDVEKYVIHDGGIIRLVGEMYSAWEHFVETANGPRPVYCDGPKSDCPICRLSAEWAMDDDVVRQERGNNMRAKEKFYFNCLDRSPSGKEHHAKTKHSKLLVQKENGSNVGPMVLQSIGQVVNMRKSQGESYNPNAYDIMLQKSGSKLSTRYGANFTGDTTPLTEEENSYELYDLSVIGAKTSTADVQAIYSYLADGTPIHDKETEFDPSQISSHDTNPVTQSDKAMAENVAKLASRPAPAKPPAKAAPPPKPKPKEGDYADTTPTDDYDPQKYYHVPCSACGAKMQISMGDDTRDMQCHGCQTVYSHPDKE